MTMLPKDVLSKIDFARLDPCHSLLHIQKACNLALDVGFRGVCVHPKFIGVTKFMLENSTIKTISVVDFPHGGRNTSMRLKDVMAFHDLGADELDIVMNISEAKAGNWNQVYDDLVVVVKASYVPVKIIVETDLLVEDEKIKAAEVVLQSGAQYLKTGTGTVKNGLGASISDIRLFAEILGDHCGIKASGGINSRRQVFDLLGSGATIIGTSGIWDM